jgi:hypothetical protein
MEVKAKGCVCSKNSFWIVELELTILLSLTDGLWKMWVTMNSVMSATRVNA